MSSRCCAAKSRAVQREPIQPGRSLVAQVLSVPMQRCGAAGAEMQRGEVRGAEPEAEAVDWADWAEGKTMRLGGGSGWTPRDRIFSVIIAPHLFVEKLYRLDLFDVLTSRRQKTPADPTRQKVWARRFFPLTIAETSWHGPGHWPIPTESTDMTEPDTAPRKTAAAAADRGFAGRGDHARSTHPIAGPEPSRSDTAAGAGSSSPAARPPPFGAHPTAQCTTRPLTQPVPAIAGRNERPPLCPEPRACGRAQHNAADLGACDVRRRPTALGARAA